jgi:tetratricopeptide (TPR) repeat protein
MRRLWPIGLILLFACKPTDTEPDATGKSAAQDAKPDAATKPDVDSKPDVDATPDKPTKPASKQAPKPKPDEARELRRKLLALLNEGRALTKKGDFATAIAKYREALVIDASDVSVLGELGWAAYKAGDLEFAHRTTVGALKFSREDKQRGMLLYNLGRVEEDRNNSADAILHYRSSLAARPGNATVQARLDALVAASATATAVPVIAQAEYSPLEALGRDLPDLAAACKQIVDARCEDYSMEEGEPCTCEPTLLATPGADQSWGLLALHTDGMPSQVAWFPVVQTDKGWTAFAEVLYEYNPGAFGIFEEVQLGESTIEPLLAKGTQLVMHVAKNRIDRDMGLNEIEFEDHAAIIVCARDELGAYCTRALIESYGYGREVDFEEEAGNSEFGDNDHEGLPSRTGLHVKFDFVDGALVVTWTDTQGGYDHVGRHGVATGWVLAAGQYPLAQLLGLATAPE